MARMAAEPIEPVDDEMTDGQQVHLLLRAGGHTLATAESLTGGRLAARITDVPGASETYLGGVVTYATTLKQTLLQVDDAIVAQHGVVSAECARAMATGVKAVTGASYALATTGVAGPAPQEGKPAGTVFVGVAGPGLADAVELSLDGDRVAIQEATCDEAIRTLIGILRREEPRLG